jgi:hypothetical protein
VVLFDGTNLNQWSPLANTGAAAWQVLPDGTMQVVPGTGDIITKMKWEDLFVHAEYMTPQLDSTFVGQARGNSGIYLKSAYEVQVLDSFGLPPLIDGCGSIYGVSAPLVTACFQELRWNTYEIEFRAPRFDAQGQKLSSARFITVYLNGVLVQTNVDVPGTTRAGQPEAPGPQPLLLQDHTNRVSFRNIWVIPR